MRRLSFVAASAPSLALALACGAPETGSPATAETAAPAVAGLLPVPEPPLDRAEPRVRQILRERRATLETRFRDARPGDRDAAEAYGELGQLYMAASYLDAAEPCFLNARLLAPEDFRWPYFLAHLHGRKGDLNAAGEDFRKALKLDPDHVAALVWLGRVLLEAGKPAEARPPLERALELHPESASAHYVLGRVKLALGEPQAAVEHLERALELHPEATVVHYPLAMAYRALGELGRAQEHLARRGEVDIFPYDPLMESLRGLLQTPFAHMDLGSQAFHKEDFEEAERHFRRAVAAAPEEAGTHFGLGAVLQAQGRLAEAEAAYEQALRLKPDYARALYNLGTVAERKGDDARASELYRRAAAADPALALPWLRAGEILRRQGDDAASLQAYVRALGLEPRNARAHFGRAMALVRLGRWQEARRALEEAARALPEQTALAHALARLLAASPDPAARDGARALELVRQLAPHQANTDLAETAAMALAELGDFAQAQQWELRALELAQRSGRADLAALMEQRLAQYRRGQPWRRPWEPDDPVFQVDRQAELLAPERVRGEEASP